MKKSNSSTWLVWWFAGWLFTMGYAYKLGQLANTNTLDIFLSIIVWPTMLGMEVCKIVYLVIR